MSVCYPHEAASTPFRFRFQWVSSALRSYDDGAEISPTSICTKRPAPLPPSDEEKIQPTADKYIPCSVSKPVPPPLPQQTSPILSSQTSSLLESPSRISLSSKYLEEKSKTMTSPSREKPYGDDFMELKSNKKNLNSLQYAFEFVDLVESRPSSSSIIHSLETRKERRTSRQYFFHVDSIRFESAAPSVYTYLDEMSAISTQTWADGVQVDYDLNVLADSQLMTTLLWVLLLGSPTRYMERIVLFLSNTLISTSNSCSVFLRPVAFSSPIAVCVLTIPVNNNKIK
uniref:Uncharacterized protein n=1 Tax=Heterorhabditis bacteriophora TaxID=37862 RepID=A0A1I7X5G0_HETBA